MSRRRDRAGDDSNWIVEGYQRSAGRIDGRCIGENENGGKYGEDAIDKADHLVEGNVLKVSIQDRRPDDCSEIEPWACQHLVHCRVQRLTSQIGWV